MASSTNTRTEDAGARLGGLADELNQHLKGASAGLRDIDAQTRKFVKESPFVAIAAALAGGFLIGRLMSRL